MFKTRKTESRQMTSISGLNKSVGFTDSPVTSSGSGTSAVRALRASNGGMDGRPQTQGGSRHRVSTLASSANGIPGSSSSAASTAAVGAVFNPGKRGVGLRGSAPVAGSVKDLLRDRDNAGTRRTSAEAIEPDDDGHEYRDLIANTKLDAWGDASNNVGMGGLMGKSRPRQRPGTVAGGDRGGTLGRAPSRGGVGGMVLASTADLKNAMFKPKASSSNLEVEPSDTSMEMEHSLTNSNNRNRTRRPKPQAPARELTASEKLKEKEKNRRSSIIRQKEYAKTLDEHRSKQATVIKVSNGNTVPIKDIRNLKRYFKELDLDGNGTIEPSEIQYRLDNQYDTGKKQSDSFLIALADQAVSKELLGKVQGGGRADDDGLTWEGMLRIVYPHCNKQDIRALLAVDAKEDEANSVFVPDLKDMDDLDAIWDMWDTDCSGELEIEEFKKALEMLGVKNDDFDEIFAHVDQTDNGGVSKMEFADWWFRDQAKKMNKSTIDLSKLKQPGERDALQRGLGGLVTAATSVKKRWGRMLR